MMTKVKVYHNPRCSKSRQAVALLEDTGCDIEIIRYLERPLTLEELKSLAKALQAGSREFMRTSEPDYKRHELGDPARTETELMQAVIEYPILLQRPIVVAGNRAVIGRPPEIVLSLLSKVK